MEEQKYRIGAYIFLGVCLVVGGCNSTYSRTAGEPKGATPVTIAEKKEEPYDPIKAHLKAREMVDPSDTRAEHRYTKKHLPREVLGPDTDIVMRKKPTEQEHQDYLKVAEARQNSWFSTLFAGNEGEGEDKVEDFKTAAMIDPKDKQKEKPRPDNKAKPEDEPDVAKDEKTADKGDDDKPAKKAAKKVAKKAEPKSEPKAAPKKVAKKAEPKAPAATKTAKAETPKHKSVTNVRIGDHPDKTRMVIDMTDLPKFTYQMQDDKNLLVVNLPGTDWNAKERKVYAHHPLLLAYIAKKSPDGGTILAFKLRKKVKVLNDTVFKPSKTAGHRIVFDIAAG